jgi:hypothetical protein
MKTPAGRLPASFRRGRAGTDRVILRMPLRSEDARAADVGPRPEVGVGLVEG